MYFDHIFCICNAFRLTGEAAHQAAEPVASFSFDIYDL